MLKSPILSDANMCVLISNCPTCLDPSVAERTCAQLHNHGKYQSDTEIWKRKRDWIVSPSYKHYMMFRANKKLHDAQADPGRKGWSDCQTPQKRHLDPCLSCAVIVKLVTSAQRACRTILPWTLNGIYGRALHWADVKLRLSAGQRDFQRAAGDGDDVRRVPHARVH